VRALAWDDEPERYLEKLKPHLQALGIELEIEDEVSVFLQRMRAEHWDLVISDLFNYDEAGDEHATDGTGIASTVIAKGIPIFVVTKSYDRAAAEAIVPRGAMIKSKHTPQTWLAEEIVTDLLRLGYPVRRDRVFVIRGRDREARGATELLVAFIRGRGLQVDVLSETTLKKEILGGLVSRMNDCAGFIAVCTPDDEWANGSWHPRQNVLLEIGVALGLSRGLDRLAILQRTGPPTEPKKNATLPTDLSGVLTMEFADDIESAFDDLVTWFDEIGVATQQTT
jgi:predicted nucleotide-binding protein